MVTDNNRSLTIMARCLNDSCGSGLNEIGWREKCCLFFWQFFFPSLYLAASRRPPLKVGSAPYSNKLIVHAITLTLYRQN